MKLTHIRIALFASATLPVTGIAEPLTLQIRGATMSNIVKELSSKTGDLYEVLPQLENEVLAISCVGKEPEEIRAQIASVLRGTWKKTEKGYRLVADEQAWRELREKQLESDASKLAQWIRDKFAVYQNPLMQADLTKHVAEAPIGRTKHYDSSWKSSDDETTKRRPRELYSRIPGNRAAAECLRIMDPRLLAGMPAQTVRVFASHPTKMQFQLPSGVSEIMASTLSEFATYEQELSSQSAIPDWTRNAGLEASLQNSPQLFLFASGPVEFVEIVVTRRDLDLAFEIQLRAFNHEGKFMFSGREYLSIPSPSLSPVDTDKLIPIESEDEEGFSATAIAAMNAFHPLQDNRNDGAAIVDLAPSGVPMGKKNTFIMMPLEQELWNRQTLSPALRAQLADPVKTDPLAYHVVEAIEMATEKGVENYIALLPDSLTQSLAPLVLPEVSRIAVRKGLEVVGMVKSDVGDWVVWEPTRVVEAYDLRLNRQRVKGLLGMLTGGAAWRLDAMATYFLERPRALSCAFDTSLISFLCPQAGASQLPVRQNLDILRFWGALNSSQRKGLVEQGRVAVSSLTHRQREIVESVIFDDVDASSWHLAGGGPNPPLVSRDRTTIMGFGIPQSATVGLDVQRSPGFLGRFEDDSIRACVGDELFQYRMISRSSSFDSSKKGDARIQSYADADIFSLRFTVSSLPDYVRICHLQDVNFHPQPRFGTEEALSNVVRERVSLLNMKTLLRFSTLPATGRRD